jgi:hypothetical protein
MKTVLHLMWHDLRIHRRLLFVWLAVLALHPMAYRIAESTTPGYATGGVNVPFLAFALVHVTRILTMALIVGRLVHADGPSMVDAFWRTRPLAPGLLATQKLTLVYTLFVGVPLLVVGAAAVAAGIERAELGWVLRQVVLAESVLVGIAVVAAAATTRTSTMLLGALAAVVVTPWTVTALGEVVRQSTLHGRLALPGATGSTIAYTVAAIASIGLAGVAWRLYSVGRDGRLRLASLTAAAVVMLTVLANSVAPVRSAAAPNDVPAMKTTLDVDDTRVDELWRDGERHVAISVVPVVSGLRPDERAQVRGHEMTLRSRDARSVVSQSMPDSHVEAPDDSTPARLTLMVLDGMQVERLAGVVADVEGSLTVEAVQHRELARVSFRPGQVLRAGPYTVRVGATRADPGVEAWMTTAVTVTERRPWFESRPWQRVDWHLASRDGRGVPVVAHLGGRLPPVLLPTVSAPFAWERRTLRWVGGVAEAAIARGDVDLVVTRVGLPRRSRHQVRLEGIGLP